MLNIGKLKLTSNLILSPLAGISDLAFRMLNRKFGCELAFVEMLNCRSISHKSKRTKQMLSTCAADKPLAVQLLGCEPKFILRALEVLDEYKFSLLDFNAACPAPKVVRRGEGAGLLKEPQKLSQLLKLIKNNSRFPLSVKIRTGWDSSSVNCREVALGAEDAGVQAVFLHGRTKAQGYSGSVDYEQIRQVKKALGIPVIASGDVLSAELAKKMLDETGCDGLAIARGALGNPWIFKEIEGAFDNSAYPERPGLAEIIATMKTHLHACCELYGERIGVIRFRKFFGWYTKGFKKIRPLREKSSGAKSAKEMVGIIEECR